MRSSIATLVISTCLAGIAGGALADPKDYRPHYERGVELYLAERYGEALRELQEAYASRPLPRLLINIGTCYRRLGQAQAALDTYRKYLALEPGAEPAVRAKVDGMIAESQAMLDAGRPPPGGKPAPRRGSPAAAFAAIAPVPAMHARPANASLFDAAGAGPDDLWVCGTQGTLAHWDGQRWDESGSGWGSLDQLWSRGRDEVWAAGGNGTVGWFDGAAWHRVPGAPRETIAAWSGAGRSDPWALDRQGSVYHFEDSAWWEVAAAERPLRLAAAFVRNPDDVWAVGQGGELVHWDGKKLTAARSSVQRDLRAVWAAGPREAWAVGDEATIVHFDGTSWGAVAAGIPATVQKGTSSSPVRNQLTGVWGSSPTDVWAVGYSEWRDEGFILHYDGRAWSVAVATLDRALYAVWGAGRDDVWVGGQRGLVLHHDGKAWSPAPDLPRTLRSFSGSAARDVWAAGDDGLLAHFDGQAWSIAHWPYGGVLHALWRGGAQDVWAAGDDGIVRHFDGARWTTLSTGTTQGLASVWGSGPRDVWAVGRAGEVRRFDGARWAKVPTGLDARPDLAAVWGTSADDVWIVGERGTILRYAGARAVRVESHVDVDLTGVWGAARDRVWFTGKSRMDARGRATATVLAWDGAAVAPVRSGLDATLGKLVGASATSVWALALPNGAVRFDGRRWQFLDAHPAAVLEGIAAGPRGEVWLVGAEGTVMVHAASGRAPRR